MEDVVRHVVIAPGDEDFLSGQSIEAIAVGLRTRAKRREVRTCLRFRQVHGAGPFAGDELRQIESLLSLGAVGRKRLDRTLGQHRTKPERHVRAMHHFVDGDFERFG